MNKIDPNFKTNLSNLILHKKGYLVDLEKRVSPSTVRNYESVGFINTGVSLRNGGTYHTTSLGRRYYKDLYGIFDYLKLVLKRKFNSKVIK